MAQTIELRQVIESRRGATMIVLQLREADFVVCPLKKNSDGKEQLSTFVGSLHFDDLRPGEGYKITSRIMTEEEFIAAAQRGLASEPFSFEGRRTLFNDLIEYGRESFARRILGF